MKNLLRYAFFCGMDALRSMEDNHKGVILVSYQVGEYRGRDNDGHAEAIKLALAMPCNIAGFHFCFSDRAHCIIAHTAVSLMPASLRAKTKIHYGSHLECQYLLSNYGIPRDAIPFKHPTNELDLEGQKYWFQQCREKELQKKHSDDQSSEAPSSQKDESNKHINFLSSLWKGDTPSDDDVLCVGRKVNRRGNERYMSLAAMHSEAYDNGSPKERRVIVDGIMREIWANGGRFLKLDTSEESGGWIQVPEDEMRHKIGQTFRNLRHRRVCISSQQPVSNRSSTISAEAGGRTAGLQTVASRPSPDATVIVDQVKPHDVLFGSRLKNHVGNKRLRELVQDVATEYDAANRGGKLRMAQQLMETVKEEGGRFLKPLDDVGRRWEIVSDKDAVKKVGAHFRNFRRKQWR